MSSKSRVTAAPQIFRCISDWALGPPALPELAYLPFFAPRYFDLAQPRHEHSPKRQDENSPCGECRRGRRIATFLARVRRWHTRRPPQRIRITIRGTRGTDVVMALATSDGGGHVASRTT